MSSSLASLPALSDQRRGLGVPTGVLTLMTAWLVPLLLPPKPCTAVYLALFGLIVIKDGLKGRRLLRYTLGPLALIAALGCLQNLTTTDLHFFAQDLWRGLKPLLILAVGFLSAASLPERLPLPLVVAAGGLAYASIYLVRLAFECAMRGAMPLDLADIVVFGHFPEALALGVCLRYPRLGREPSNALWLLRRVTVLAAVLALLLSGSRTWLVAAGVMAMAGSGWMRGRGRWRAVLLGAPILAAVLFTPFGQLLFTKGFDVALAELSPARYVEMADINDNWRGYEAYQGMQTVSRGTAAQRALGQGFGAQADIGLFMNLGGAEFHEIGQFHNGYVWLILKAGWVGLALFGFWIWRLYQLARGLKRRELTERADLLQGIALTLMFTTLVVSGIFNPLSNDALLLAIGALAAPLAAPRSSASR